MWCHILCNVLRSVWVWSVILEIANNKSCKGASLLNLCLAYRVEKVKKTNLHDRNPKQRWLPEFRKTNQPQKRLIVLIWIRKSSANCRHIWKSVNWPECNWFSSSFAEIEFVCGLSLDYRFCFNNRHWFYNEFRRQVISSVNWFIRCTHGACADRPLAKQQRLRWSGLLRHLMLWTSELQWIQANFTDPTYKFDILYINIYIIIILKEHFKTKSSILIFCFDLFLLPVGENKFWGGLFL